MLTIQASNGVGAHVNLTWLGYKAGVPSDDPCCAEANSHHAAAHSNGQAKTDVDTWFFKQLAYLLQKLKDEREDASSISDSCLVVCPNNMDYGERHGVHNLPWLLAGSAGGYFKTGRVVPSNNASHTRVLAGICSAMGVSPDGLIDPAYGDTELPGLRA